MGPYDTREILGYLRCEVGKPEELKCFLARDREAAGRLLGHVAAKNEEVGAIRVALHPDARAVKEWFPWPYREELKRGARA